MIAIFDLEGTLALTEHRQHFLEEKPKNWKAFHEACVDDLPNIPLIRLFNLYQINYRQTWIFTGRSETVYDETLNWLETNHIAAIGRIKMRKTNDPRDDTVVKREMLDELLEHTSYYSHLRQAKQRQIDTGIIIFDDRQKVVDMWREMGLTCCQVAPGNF